MQGSLEFIQSSVLMKAIEENSVSTCDQNKINETFIIHKKLW